MPFFDYIMSILFPKGFKLPISMELYEGSTDSQEHLDAFKSKMILARASDPIKYRAFPIMLKKAVLRWFNSLPLRSISKF